MKNKPLTYLTQAAMIAALYVVLTLLAHVAGLAVGPIQIRFSEALTVLPFFTAAAVPGLAVGCLIANLLVGAHLIDIIFGSLATLLGALGTYWLGRRGATKWLAPVPPIVANAAIVPWILYFAYGFREVWLSTLTVAAGQVVACGVLGMILFVGLEKRKVFR